MHNSCSDANINVDWDETLRISTQNIQQNLNFPSNQANYSMNSKINLKIANLMMVMQLSTNDLRNKILQGHDKTTSPISSKLLLSAKIQWHK